LRSVTTPTDSKPAAAAAAAVAAAAPAAVAHLVCFQLLYRLLCIATAPAAFTNTSESLLLLL
jgi:hypothetical protein